MRTFAVKDRQTPSLVAEILWAIGIKIYEIRVYDDGIVEFCRRRTTSRVAACAIELIAVQWTWTTDTVSCHLHIFHGLREIVVPCFPNAEEFLTLLSGFNPDIIIDGYVYTGARC